VTIDEFVVWALDDLAYKAPEIRAPRIKAYIRRAYNMGFEAAVFKLTGEPPVVTADEDDTDA
jgi:hypothetical protein